MERTDPRTLLVNIARIFDELKLPYLVTGGMAVLVWGRPRFTADIDVVIEILGQKIYFTSPEDLILSKLKWFKESRSNRHLEDAESVLKISEENLDFAYLKVWGEKLQLGDEFKELMGK